MNIQGGEILELVLHIGQGKAGSTAIQRSLDANREELMRAGCLYPDTLYIKELHHWLAPLHFDNPMRFRSVAMRMGGSANATRIAAQNEWENLERQIRELSPKHIVLSTETLFNEYSEAEIQRAKTYLPRLTSDVRVLSYIRSPISRYLSLVQQSLRSSRGILPPQPSRASYVLAAYPRIFGVPVEARVFDRRALLQNDVVADFLQWANLPVRPGSLHTVSANESLSAEAMFALNRLNVEEFPKTKKIWDWTHLLRRAVAQADSELEGATRPRLKQDFADHLMRIDGDLLILRDSYGLVFDDVDYDIVGAKSAGDIDKFSAPRLEDLCNFDEYRRGALEVRISELVEEFSKQKQKWQL